MLLDNQMDDQPYGEWRDIWRWLGENAAGYPVGTEVPPWRAPKTPGRVRLWGAVEVVSADLPGSEGPVPVCVDVARPGLVASAGSLGQGCSATDVGTLLFARSARGCAYVLGRGGRRDLHVVWRAFAREWVAQGYTLAPLMQGGDVRCLTVRKSGHAWHLVDWRGLTGLDPAGLPAQLVAFGGERAPHEPRAVGLMRAVQGWAAFVRDAFGVEPRLTLGQTAGAAASAVLPPDRWLWRPPAITLALCREGAAFRGGYCYYPAYRGPGHRIDMRRAYAWALSRPLPCGTAKDRCVEDGDERAGIYVCRVRGPGVLPAYVGAWRGPHGGFERRLWSGDAVDCVLPQCEFAGLRALGYAVEAGWGVCWQRAFTLSGLTAASEGVGRAYGWGSPHATAAKLLVNAVYGKLAENPERDGVVFSTDPPSPWHLPYSDSSGEFVDGAWCDQRLEFRAHQHADVAAEVTGAVRGRLYGAAGQLQRGGVRVLAADTDGVVTREDPRRALDLTGDSPGDWYYGGYDPRMTIAAPRFAAWFGKTISAGTSPQPPDVVELAYDRGLVSVRGKVMAPPWVGGAIEKRVRRVLRRGA